MMYVTSVNPLQLVSLNCLQALAMSDSSRYRGAATVFSVSKNNHYMQIWLFPVLGHQFPHSMWGITLCRTPGIAAGKPGLFLQI
jgi:hypothetical protein